MKILVYKMNVNFEQFSLLGFEFAIKIAYLTRSVFHSTFIDVLMEGIIELKQTNKKYANIYWLKFLLIG